LAQFEAEWVSHILAWRGQTPKPAGRSNRRGWNSELTVFKDPTFQALSQCAHAAFKLAVQDLKLKRSVTFGLEAWVNMHDPGGYNLVHMHPNRLLSGVYYLQAPDGAGPIIFRDPRPSPALILLDGDGVHSGRNLRLQPKTGQLIIFPNWLEHFVESNEAPDPRISIAMNAVLVQQA
jgi:uncharacterized protein (TIGR02466 family)